MSSPVAQTTPSGPKWLNQVTGGPNDTITLGNRSNTVIGGPDDMISVGNGSNQLVAAPGDVWTVGNRADVFKLAPGFGNNTINGFQTSKDVLNFDPALMLNYMAAMADTKQVGANTVITVDAYDSVTLAGVAASHLTAQQLRLQSLSRNARRSYRICAVVPAKRARPGSPVTTPGVSAPTALVTGFRLSPGSSRGRPEMTGAE